DTRLASKYTRRRPADSFKPLPGTGSGEPLAPMSRNPGPAAAVCDPMTRHPDGCRAGTERVPSRSPDPPWAFTPPITTHPDVIGAGSYWNDFRLRGRRSFSDDNCFSWSRRRHAFTNHDAAFDAPSS